jgi:hypothetical protein
MKVLRDFVVCLILGAFATALLWFSFHTLNERSPRRMAEIGGIAKMAGVLERTERFRGPARVCVGQAP